MVSPTSRGFLAFCLEMTMQRELFSLMPMPSEPGARVRVSVVGDMELIDATGGFCQSTATELEKNDGRSDSRLCSVLMEHKTWSNTLQKRQRYLCLIGQK